jgi:drug/metabolite transporter (DMT)-like permease
MVIYGANYVISKEVTPYHIKPFGLVVFRVASALLLFWLVALIWVRQRMEKKDILRCAFLALLGVAINQMLFLKGLSMTLPINASIMMITTPILVVVLGFLFKREKANKVRLLGIGLGFLGAILFINIGSAAVSGNYVASAWGDVFILINALSWGMYLIFVKPLMQKYHTITIVRWVFLFGLIYVTPFGIQECLEVNWQKFDGIVWFNFIYILIFTTFVAYIFNTYALKALSASVVSAYIYLQPFLAALFGVIWGMEILTLEKIIYALIVFIGVYLAGKG